MKFFCVGHNKTGTTSLLHEFSEFGFNVAPQHEGEKLLEDYLSKDYQKIIDFCEKYDVFQDVPFSLKNTYKLIEKEFPESKFILSVRNSSEEWYSSVINFHSKIFGHNQIPNIHNLLEANHIKKAWIWTYMQNVYDVDSENPYDRKKLIDYYESHNKEIWEYFSQKNNFISINLSKDSDYDRFKKFIDKSNNRTSFFHLNKSLNYLGS
jgi:hypothetical protein